MTLDDLIGLLEHTPVIADIHPVSIYYLPREVTVLDSMAEAAWLLDDPEPMLPRQMLVTAFEAQYDGRLPHIRCDHDPFTPALNTILFEHFGDIGTRMLLQSQVADRIVADAIEYDLVVLFLVDGLSYQDVRWWTSSFDHTFEIEPCLVNTPTLTHLAFPNLIGVPSLAARMFDAGYHNRLGFTYWVREDNKLTDRMFQAIPEVRKCGHFPQILTRLRDYLDGLDRAKTYIQIVRTGLDGYAHGQKRKPPVVAIVEEVRQEFKELGALCVQLCSQMGLRACLYLAADHGILWRDEFEPEIVGNAPANSSARWCGWRDLYHQSDEGRRIVVEGIEYYCLGFPNLRRQLHIDEQGLHGGISFQESVVPLITARIGD